MILGGVDNFCRTCGKMLSERGRLIFKNQCRSAGGYLFMIGARLENDIFSVEIRKYLD